MPLFMDFHIIDGITIEGLKEGHIADKALESKHNTRILQFWVNPEMGTVFCLMEAPNKEACVAVHQESHGQIACKVEEVEPGFFHLFMGENHRVEHGIVKQDDGSIDLGYRFIFTLEIEPLVKSSAPGMFELKVPAKVDELIVSNIRSTEGREVKTEGAGTYTVVFKDAMLAVEAASELQRILVEKTTHSTENDWQINFRIGMTGGQPLTKDEGFFERVLSRGKRLTFIAKNKEILMSPLVKSQAGLKEDSINSYLQMISEPSLAFLENLFNVVEKEIANDQLNVEFLSRKLGISRPQLYRKTIEATGKSPSSFIREVRMQKALALIQTKKYNISEVSLQVGINNPSYFSKCFRERFGVPPSKVS